MNIDKCIVLDIELYKNYLLVMFKKVRGGKPIYFEKFNGSTLNISNVLHIINKYTIVSFNGNNYDQVILEAACQGFNTETLKKISDAIIGESGKRGLAAWQARKQFGVAKLQMDHIDLIEVAPLKASLKIYGGRLHSPTLKDLPVDPDELITEDQLEEMRFYCGNDLDLTIGLFKSLIPEITLREKMSGEYGVDLRSKSDAQIAEAVIVGEMNDKYGIKLSKPKIKSGTEFHYKAPDNIQFETPELQDLLRQYTTLPVTLESSGYTSFNFELVETDRIKSGKNKGKMPDKKSQLKFTIGNTKYTVGIGGLHSCEKSVTHKSSAKVKIKDKDVASYYPRIILNNDLAPKHIGKPFLDIYNSIVERRLKAKRSGDKVTNESLKITINGSFGKFGSKWSVLYSPDLMLQVTITGQLTLLMLIERLELAGIPVISGNTDGIVLAVPVDKEDLAESICEDWEFDTGYELETNNYVSLHSRDVNNYIAIKEDSCKGKGAYADQRDHYYRLRSNPNCEIATDAAIEYIRKRTPLEDTVKSCTDITKFTTIRTVNGGATKGGELIGKAIRWYYGSEELDAIYYSTNGNKVPKSEGAVPLMVLPEKLPSDIDYNWYIAEAEKRLKEIGVIYTKKALQA